MNNRTLCMIKPDAVAAGNIGKILTIISSAGFKITAMKLTKLTTEEAKKFYSVHKGKSFFEDLVGFMSSAPIVAIILEKENAVKEFRTLIGATNPAEAAEGTLRKLFATSMQLNAVHGSDSDENVAIEISFHFSGREEY